MSPSSNDPSSNRSPRGSQWANIVRGDSNGGAAPSNESPNRDAEEPSNGGESFSNVKKSAWNKPSNGSIPVTLVLGSCSWPALSEETNPATKSSASPSDSMKTDTDGSASLPLSPRPAAVSSKSLDHQKKVTPINSNHNPNPTHQNPIQPGSSSSSSSADAEAQLNGGSVSPQKPQLLPEKPAGNGQEPSPREMPHNRNNYHGSKGSGFPSHSHGGPDHHRPFHRRGNNGGGGGGGPHNSVRRDPDRGGYSGGWNNASPRYIPSPPPLPRGHHLRAPFMRPSPPRPPAGAVPYMQPPLPPPMPMRPFVNLQTGFFEIPPQLYYMPLHSPPPPPPPPVIAHLPVPHAIPSAMMLNVMENPGAMVLQQIEYYFSDTNLKDDSYLRSQMDEQGWVPVSLIAGFNRVKQYTNNIPNNIHFILDVLQTSEVVEVQGERIRKRRDWMSWLLPRMQNLVLEGSSKDQHPESH